MMVTLELTREEAARVLAFLAGDAGHPSPAAAPPAAAATGKKRGRPKAAANPEPAPEPAPEAKPELVSETKPASLADMLGTAPAPAVQAPKLEQKDLIAAFVDLGNSRGIEAVKSVLAKFNVGTVTQIAEEKWHEAVAACTQF